MFFEVRFFGSFGQLAVQAAQIWAVFGRRVCVQIWAAIFLGGQGM
jgi:hypothetical protein